MALSQITRTAMPRLRSSLSLSAASSQLCTRCFRQYYLRQQPVFQSRRTQATAAAAAHRIQEFPTGPVTQTPPPRNAGIPETSIAGGKPQIDDTHPEQSQAPDTQNSDISITEREAQTPRQTSGPSSAIGSIASEATTATSTKPQRRPKLRPRKAAMTLTPSAVTQLQELLNQPDPKLIRVGVKNRGCSGLAYHLEYVDNAGAFDEAVEQDGVKVLIDSKALFSIIGSEMDWAEDKLSRRFVFRNPNITEQCGCGESFSIG